MYDFDAKLREGKEAEAVIDRHLERWYEVLPVDMTAASMVQTTGGFTLREIIRQGYGHAYTQFPFKHIELFTSYQRWAREAGKGLWGGAK